MLHSTDSAVPSRAVPKCLSFRDRSAVRSSRQFKCPYISLEILTTEGDGHPLQAQLEQSQANLTCGFIRIQHPPEKVKALTGSCSAGVPCVPRPHHGVTPAVTVAGSPAVAVASVLRRPSLPWQGPPSDGSRGSHGGSREESLSQQWRWCGARGTKAP